MGGLKPITINSPSEILEDAVTTGVMKDMGVDEHSLMVRLNNYGLVVIAGCSHPGINNIVRRVHEMFDVVYL